MTTTGHFQTEASLTCSKFECLATGAPGGTVERLSGDRRLRRLILGVAMTVMAAAPARSTILFRPVGRPPEVFSYGGVTMSQPLSNTLALSSPKVYFIFVGPNWGTNGNPSVSPSIMTNAANAIMSSSYLSGLTQYGSDGQATYGGYTVDTTVDPTKPGVNGPHHELMWSEIDKTLAKSEFSSWLPPGGDGSKGPIYVVVNYKKNGTGGTGGYGGYNTYGSNTLPYKVHAISVGIRTADQVDGFTWALSHELVERMSTGTGTLTEVSPSPGAQICDGEPEGGNNYDWRIGGSGGPMVTSYWSFLDQAFIVPDGKLDRVLLVPIWGGTKFTHKLLSLQQGTLYEITKPDAKTEIDHKVQSFVVNVSGGNAQIFDLAASGEVRLYDAATKTWTPVTDRGIMASSLVETTYLQQTGTTYTRLDGVVFMLSNHQVWGYNNIGTSWFSVLRSKVTATGLVEAAGFLYENTTSVGVFQSSFFPGMEPTGTTLTGTGPGSNSAVLSMASAGGSLYLLAQNVFSNPMPAVWRLAENSRLLEQITSNTTFVYSIAAAGDVLCMLATGPGVSGIIGVAEYGLTSRSWIPLTGSNTVSSQILVQDGSELYMLAANDGGPLQVWQYNTPGNWTALTGTNTSIKSVSVATDNTLHMVASNSGGPIQDWVYSGTPGDWNVVK